MANDPQIVDVDVVVVGAGLAGLAAARAVLRAGRSAIVIEARDRVGGRVLNEEIGDGQVVEVGGQWVGPTQDRVYALARELGIETYPTYQKGKNLIELSGKQRRYKGTIPRLNPLVLLSVGRTQRRLNRLAATVPPDAPWRAPNAAELDSQTLQSWLQDNVRSRAARQLFTIAVRSVWGTEPGDISLLHALAYTHQAGTLEMLLDTEGGAQEERFVGGSALLADGLAEQLADRVGRLVLDSPVRRIDYGADGVRVTADGCIARGARAIVAVPPLLAGRIEYEPALPALREQLTQRMPQGSYIKCMAVYDKPFWREEGLTGEALYDEGPVNLMFDNTPPEGTPGVLLGFIGGADARKWIDADPGERGQAVIGCFTRLFGQRAAVPRRYIEKNWAAERWTGGCPTSYFPPGGWTSYGPALRTPVGPIHWAGTETARQWTGYMEGALESAERAAAEVLTAGARSETAVPA